MSVTTAEHYMQMATKLRAKARKEQSPHVRQEYLSLAECYALLARRPRQNEFDDSQESVSQI